MLGVPELYSTPVTTPLLACEVLVLEVTFTVWPINEAACKPCMSVVMVWDCCNALNCANCAANAVSLCGLSGSCEVICVTSNFKKSAWFKVLLPEGVVTEVMADMVQAQDSQPGRELVLVEVFAEESGLTASGPGNSG